MFYSRSKVLEKWDTTQDSNRFAKDVIPQTVTCQLYPRRICNHSLKQPYKAIARSLYSRNIIIEVEVVLSSEQNRTSDALTIATHSMNF